MRREIAALFITILESKPAISSFNQLIIMKNLRS